MLFETCLAIPCLLKEGLRHRQSLRFGSNLDQRHCQRPWTGDARGQRHTDAEPGPDGRSDQSWQQRRASVGFQGPTHWILEAKGLEVGLRPRT